MAQRDLQIGTWVTQTAASPASMKTSTDVPKKKNLLLPKGLFCCYEFVDNKKLCKHQYQFTCYWHIGTAMHVRCEIVAAVH